MLPALTSVVRTRLSLLLIRQPPVDPVDKYPAPLHAPEPGHLPLGKTMDLNLKLPGHLRITHLIQ